MGCEGQAQRSGPGGSFRNRWEASPRSTVSCHRAGSGEGQAGQVLKVRSLDFILGARREEAAGHF